MPTKTYRLLPVFVPLIIHNLTRAAYSPNGFHKLSRPGLEPATHRWESQHSNHAATPTCFSQAAKSKVKWLEGYPQHWRAGEESPHLQRIFHLPEQTCWLYTTSVLCLLLLFSQDLLANSDITYWPSGESNRHLLGVFNLVCTRQLSHAYMLLSISQQFQVVSNHQVALFYSVF